MSYVPLALDDDRWDALVSGYRVAFNPTSFIGHLIDNPKDDAVWSQLVPELYHQGTVGSASYAVVPWLVRICEDHDYPFEDALLLAVLVELARQDDNNPPLPDFLTESYHASLHSLNRLSLQRLPDIRSFLHRRGIFALAAVVADDYSLGELLIFVEGEKDVSALLEDYYKDAARIPGGRQSDSKQIDSVSEAQPTAVGHSSLDPRFVKAERVSWAIFVGILILGWLAHALAAFFFGADSKPILSSYAVVATAGFVALMGILGFVWPPVVYRHRSYRITEHGLQIRKGVWWRAIIDVPHSRVQHTDVTQGPLERRYGLGKLVVHTAGTMSATVELEGLSHETALQLRDRLTGADDDESV